MRNLGLLPIIPLSDLPLPGLLFLIRDLATGLDHLHRWGPRIAWPA